MSRCPDAEQRIAGARLIRARLGAAPAPRARKVIANECNVLVIGAGGLGSPAALYLAAAGVGTIGIADFDVVDVSNLQRQVVHTTARVGTPKTASAAAAIAALDPAIDRKSTRLNSSH